MSYVLGTLGFLDSPGQQPPPLLQQQLMHPLLPSISACAEAAAALLPSISAWCGATQVGALTAWSSLTHTDVDAPHDPNERMMLPMTPTERISPHTKHRLCNRPVHGFAQGQAINELPRSS